MSKFIKVKHPNFEISIELLGKTTCVNNIRNILKYYINHNNLNINEVKLELYDGQEIPYTTIQTRRGLGSKSITWEELFLRGGKIFD